MEWTGINKVLDNFQSHPKIKNKLRTQIIKNCLKERAGIKSVAFKNGKLEIKVKSSALLQELFLEKENLKREINEYLKKNLVKEVGVKRY